MNVLIIEDDPGAAEMLSQRFHRIGLEVRVADSKADAMAIINAADPKPEVITVDINLADSRGDETIEWVQLVRAASPDAVILIISGVLKPTDAERLAKLGADASFEKMDITTEKSWWTRFLDALSGVANQAPLHRNLEHVRTLSQKATEIYNESGASLRLTPTPTEDHGKPEL